jgi:hypothetical protein
LLILNIAGALMNLCAGALRHQDTTT